MQEIRRKLRNGYIVPPEKYGISEISWRNGIDYESLSDAPESFKWWLSCLGFLKLLMTSEKFSDSDAEIVKFIIEDWAKHSGKFSRTWDGHAVALRVEVLVETVYRMEESSWLSSILDEHLDYLVLERNFQGNWNHGIDQARSLIRISALLRNEAAKELGLNRLIDALNVVVDDEGVTVEQSIHYQLYNYKQIKMCVELLESIGLDPNDHLKDVLKRFQLMPVFLAHATKPDGFYFEIGDTPVERAEVIPGTFAEYAASMGKSGQRIKDRVKVFENSGYIFGRSGWGEAGRAFTQESAYSIRFGPSRKIHGHNDHFSLIYISRGREIIRDGGFHGYTDDSVRKYLRACLRSSE